MEQSMTPAGPPEPPAPDAAPRAAASRRRAAWIALGVLLLAAVAVAAYFIGRSSANAPQAYDRGYARGRTATAREFARGTPRYQTIYNAGFRVGHAAGLKAGQRAGAEKGTKVGLEHGKAIGRLQGERRGGAGRVHQLAGGQLLHRQARPRRAGRPVPHRRAQAHGHRQALRDLRQRPGRRLHQAHHQALTEPG